MLLFFRFIFCRFFCLACSSSLCLSVLSICLPDCLSVYVSLFLTLFLCLSLSPTLSLSIYVSICISVYLSISSLSLSFFSISFCLSHSLSFSASLILYSLLSLFSVNDSITLFTTPLSVKYKCYSLFFFLIPRPRLPLSLSFSTYLSLYLSISLSLSLSHSHTHTQHPLYLSVPLSLSLTHTHTLHSLSSTLPIPDLLEISMNSSPTPNAPQQISICSLQCLKNLIGILRPKNTEIFPDMCRSDKTFYRGYFQEGLVGLANSGKNKNCNSPMCSIFNVLHCQMRFSPH